MPKLTAAQARRKHQSTFDQFWRAYPRHTHINEAAATWANLMEDGQDAAKIIAAAQRYSASRPEMKFVPGPHNWLKAGQYDDSDIFQDERDAQMNWLREMWKTCNVKAVENRFHVSMPKAYPPDDIEAKDIEFWYRTQARAWISEIQKEKFEKCQPPQSMTSEPSKPSSVESSSSQMSLAI